MNLEGGLSEWIEPEWFASIDITELESLAGIGYSPTQIAKYLSIPVKEFLWFFNLNGSKLQYHYERGVLVQRATEGMAMAGAAQTGENATQAQRFDKFRAQQKFRESVNRIFFEDLNVQ